MDSGIRGVKGSTEKLREANKCSSEHSWGMWDEPMIISETLVQYRQCLECGEAEARRVGY